MYFTVVGCIVVYVLCYIIAVCNGEVYSNIVGCIVVYVLCNIIVMIYSTLPVCSVEVCTLI